MSEAATPVPYVVQVARLPKKGVTVRLEATDAQRKALAEAHGLLSVEAYGFDLLVAPWRGDGVKVSGTVTAEVTQQCVVTLEPLPARVEADVEGVFVPEGSRLARVPDGAQGEIMVHADAPDMPEAFAGQSIDAGALAEEFFELAIDPYPRKPGAELEQPATGDAAETSPFAALSALKRNEESGK